MAKPAQAKKSATNPDRAARIFASPISASRMRGDLACLTQDAARSAVGVLRTAGRARTASCTNRVRRSVQRLFATRSRSRFVPVKTRLRVITDLPLALPALLQR